jgi:hypothetical protein
VRIVAVVLLLLVSMVVEGLGSGSMAGGELGDELVVAKGKCVITWLSTFHHHHVPHSPYSRSPTPQQRRKQGGGARRRRYAPRTPPRTSSKPRMSAPDLFNQRSRTSKLAAAGLARSDDDDEGNVEGHPRRWCGQRRQRCRDITTTTVGATTLAQLDGATNLDRENDGRDHGDVVDDVSIGFIYGGSWGGPWRAPRA